MTTTNTHASPINLHGWYDSFVEPCPTDRAIDIRYVVAIVDERETGLMMLENVRWTPNGWDTGDGSKPRKVTASYWRERVNKSAEWFKPGNITIHPGERIDVKNRNGSIMYDVVRTNDGWRWGDKPFNADDVMAWRYHQPVTTTTIVSEEAIHDLALNGPTIRIGSLVETIKGANFWGRVIAIDTDEANPGCTVLAIAPGFEGTKHVYPLKQLRVRPMQPATTSTDDTPAPGFRSHLMDAADNPHRKPPVWNTNTAPLGEHLDVIDSTGYMHADVFGSMEGWRLHDGTLLGRRITHWRKH